MDYQIWESEVPDTITGDILWKVQVYRLALYAADIGWYDVTKLGQDHRTIKLSDQLYRALGSISANVAEGYSRSSSKDQARFYEYSLGSARESRDWYFKSRHILGNTVAEHRMALLTKIIRLLLTTIPKKRGRTLREEHTPYSTLPEDIDLESLLKNIPF